MSLTTKIIPLLWWIVAPVLVAKLLISFGVLFVEDKQIDTRYEEVKKSSYLYSFPKFFTTVLKEKTEPTKVQKNETLGKLKLKACYIEKGREFIIVNEGVKTLFIDLESSYKGAKLIKVKRDYAVFVKDGVDIELALITKTTTKKRVKKSKIKSDSDDRYINVERNSFKKYMKSPKQALRDIRFKEIKVDKNFAGFKLSFVRKGSFFDKMQLKKGDIIKSIDGNELKSMMDLLPYYNLLEDSTTLLIGFERDGDIKEIMYEID